MRALFFPAPVQGAQIQQGAHEDAFSMHATTAVAIDDITYVQANTSLARECKQSLSLVQHAWRLDGIVCSLPRLL